MTRVLVVDDSRETCDLLEELLGGMGLEVAKATKPERFTKAQWRRLRAHAVRYQSGSEIGWTRLASGG